MTQPVSPALSPALGHAVQGSAPGLAPQPLAPRLPLARSVPTGGERGQHSACSGLGVLSSVLLHPPGSSLPAHPDRMPRPSSGLLPSALPWR